MRTEGIARLAGNLSDAVETVMHCDPLPRRSHGPVTAALGRSTRSRAARGVIWGILASVFAKQSRIGA
jgi:hypothetical protein